jgi:hypothetical protein
VATTGASVHTMVDGRVRLGHSPVSQAAALREPDEQGVELGGVFRQRARPGRAGGLGRRLVTVRTSGAQAAEPLLDTPSRPNSTNYRYWTGMSAATGVQPVWVGSRFAWSTMPAPNRISASASGSRSSASKLGSPAA